MRTTIFRVNSARSRGPSFQSRHGRAVLHGQGVLWGGGKNGDIVGYSQTEAGWHAILWDESLGLRNLNTPFDDSGAGWIAQRARRIHDRGWIVGHGITPTGQQHAMLLVPAIEDGDPDGLPDNSDSCMCSIMDEDRQIDGCKTGVENRLMDDGCTFMDVVEVCADVSENHGQFVVCVVRLVPAWRLADLIGRRDRGTIIRCVARSNSGNHPRDLRTDLLDIE